MSGPSNQPGQASSQPNQQPPQPQRTMSTSGPSTSGGAGSGNNVTTPATPTAPHPPAPAANASTTSSQTSQNLNQIVIDYLNKKGYSRSEQTLRQEMANVDANGRVIIDRAEDRGGVKWRLGYHMLHNWIDDTLEIYKIELNRLKWPVFVYCFLGLVKDYYPEMASQFMNDFKSPFTQERAADLQELAKISHPDHIKDSATAKAYSENKYRLTLTQASFLALVQFLEAKDKDGGSVILFVLNNSMRILTVDRTTSGADRALAAMFAGRGRDADVPDEDEGIPGHNPGSANTDPNAPPVLTKLNLGPLPMETEMAQDVREELEEEDMMNPPRAGDNSLVEEFDRQIKREPSEDAPTRDQIPLPKPLARDVASEIQRIKDHRDRFKITTKTNGVGAGISVTMFTIHNTFDSVNCLDFSGDSRLVAAGTAESYIRVWSLEGKPLSSILPDGEQQSSSRRLIGHSGPVYAVSFSPSINSDKPEEETLTSSRYLLSSSGDKTVRLWSLDTWTNLVVYRGHDHPVWDVKWGPFGHYFLSGSHDHTARLWSTDNVSPLRIFAGHDQDVDCVAFHPNNAYVFTGSCDRTVRMWDVSRGSAVRMFTGHTANITAMSCSPNGKTLATGDDAGAIFLWELASGRRVKRMRGHGKGGIWSLAWSVEGTLLVSGGADNTVRVWDVAQPTEGSAAVKVNGDGSGKGEGGASAGGAGGGLNRKTKVKDATVTPDQISAFPTKKTPVYKVAFTSMNLAIAGGCYLP